MKTRRIVVAGLTVLTLAVAGCGGHKASGGAASRSAGVTGTVTVFAAASLTESFTQIGKDFEAANPGTKVTFNFAGSAALATQINQGAPADVFASADEDNLKKTTDAGTVTPPPVVFAKNRLEIAVEKGNPKKIKSLADLQKSGLVVVLCADQVPCGKYAAESLAKAGVTITPASKEENAKATLSKVSIGEADASIVYVTDVKAAKGATGGVKIADKVNVIATYPMGVVKESRNETAAKAWVQFVKSDEAQKTLRKFGFLPP